MLNIVIFGPPGSGKGTQSVKIAEKYNLIHLSTGELLREEISKDTKIGKQVKSYIDDGKLVPDEIIYKKVYSKSLEYISSPGIIYDGFPRTIIQAELLDKMLNERNKRVDLVVSIEVEEEELFKRMMGRSEDSNRSDDKERIILKRIAVYKEQTHPLIAHYESQGKLVSVDGMASVDSVFEKICYALDTYISSNNIVHHV